MDRTLDARRDPDVFYVFRFFGNEQVWLSVDWAVDQSIAHSLFATRIARERTPMRLYHGDELVAERGANII